MCKAISAANCIKILNWKQNKHLQLFYACITNTLHRPRGVCIILAAIVRDKMSLSQNAARTNSPAQSSPVQSWNWS